MTTGGDLSSFLAEAEALLTGCHARRSEAVAAGRDNDRVVIFPEQRPEQDKADLAAARDWRRARVDAGFGWIDGPRVYGGRGLSTGHARAFAELEAQYATPSMGTFSVTDGMVIPIVLAYGTEKGKATFLPALVRGDLVTCQLFSEPGAGSDLGEVLTKAVADGDRWIVTGQKVWSSVAHLADVGLLLARTNPEAGKHRNLTMFLVDMHDPGVLVRPLRQMTGGSSFNEVFLDQAIVPDWMRLGDVDAGWTIAMSTLGHERAMAAELDWLMMGAVDRLRALVARRGDGTDPLIRQRLAEVWSHARVAELTAERAAVRATVGGPGQVGSVIKLTMTENLRRISAAVSDVLGPRLVADCGERDTYAWSEFVLSAPALRLAGGSDEIQRNTIADRILGLPRAPKA